MKRSIPSVVPAQYGVTVSRDFSINGFGDSIDLSSNSMDFSSNSMDFSSGSIDFSSGSINLSFSEMSSCRTISSSSGSRPLLERAGRKPAKKKGIASMSRVSSASIARAAQPFGRGQDYQYDFNDDLSFLGMTPSRDDQYEYVWKRPRYDDNRQRSHNETIAVPNALSEASRSAIETEDRARVLAATIYPIPEEQKARMDQAFGGHISVRSAKGFMGYLSEGAKGVVMSISNAAIVSPSRAAPKTVPEVVLAEPLRKPISETSMSTHPYQTSEGTLVVAYAHARLDFTNLVTLPNSSTATQLPTRKGDLLAVLSIHDNEQCTVQAVESPHRSVFKVPNSHLKMLGRSHWKSVA